jgi:ADP-heptose:LPS heptosyltransferase
MRVGLVWAAGPWNKSRSIDLADLSPLRTVLNVSFYSLQWGPDWIEAQRAHHSLPIHNVTVPIPEDLLYTANTISQLDLVITVDTMVAHLAGAMGKPVWLLLPYDCDWRWLTGTDTSPWYPTVKLFRQVQRGDWSRPVYNITEALQRHSLVTGTT